MLGTFLLVGLLVAASSVVAKGSSEYVGMSDLFSDDFEMNAAVGKEPGSLRVPFYLKKGNKAFVCQPLFNVGGCLAVFAQRKS